jgi:hypothetical protein
VTERISNGEDVVSFLKEQHEQIKMGFTQVNIATGDQRKHAFYALRRLLAVHETAEEQIIHPAAREALPNGDRLIELRLKEENEAKNVLSQLEEVDVDSARFDTLFSTLQSLVLSHAEAEEQEEFAPLTAHLDASRLERMKTVAQLAESFAPTRPHPGVESATANFLVGPFGSMIDRLRDAFSGKT